ncbi:MAG: exopolysaccharide transport family protein [Spirochaetota bacterium]
MAEQQQQSSMNMRDIFNTLFRHKWLVIICFLLGTLGSVFYLLYLPETYVSNAKIYVSSGQSNPMEMLTGVPASSEINTEVEILRSRGFAEKVVDEIGPENILYVPEVQDNFLIRSVKESEVLKKLNLALVNGQIQEDAVDPVAYREKAVKVFINTLETGIVPRSNIINLAYYAATPHLARDILSEVVSLYTEKHIDVHTSAVSLEFISRETERLAQELKASENELRNYQEQFNIISFPEQQTILLDRISAIESSIEETETLIISSQAAIEKMHSDIEMRGQLKEEEVRLASLQARLIPLKERLSAEREKLKRLRGSEQEYTLLQNRVSNLRQNYSRYRESLEQARIAQTLENQKISNVSVMQQPTLVLEPVTQERKKKFALGLFLGIVGGVGLAFVLDYFNHKIKSKEELARILGLKNVSAIPRINHREMARLLKRKWKKGIKNTSLVPKKLSKNVTVWLYLNQEVHDCFEKLRNDLYKKIQAREGDRSKPAPYVLAVLSTYRGEGVTSVATGIAYALAMADGDNILLVDSNNHYPDQEKVFGANRPPGLYEMSVQGQAQQMNNKKEIEMFQNMEMSKQMGAMSSSERVGRLLPSVQRLNYKLIVMDSPSINESAAAVKSAALADGVMLVVESERVRREVVQYVKEQLDEAGAHLAGAILNKRRLYIPKFFYKRM